MTFGVTPTGFVRKKVENFKTEWATKQKADMDPNVDVDADSPLGQLNGILANALAEGWEALESVYNSFNPNAAEGNALINAALLTGTEKRGAAPSTVACDINLDAGATAPAGFIVSLDTREDVRFQLIADVTNPGPSTDTLSGEFECLEDGPIEARAGHLTNIVTPVSGVNSVTNPLDAALGHLADDDISLRIRRQQQLALQGGSTVAAIVADLLEIESIADVVPLENTSDHFDPETGLPAHSFEMMIVDDNLTPDDTVAQTIFESNPTGIRAYGNTSGNATDANGKEHVIKFSRADNVLVYIALELSVSGLFPEDGEDQVITAVLAKCRSTFGISDDVVGGAIEAAAFSVAGVVDATAYLGFAPVPTSTDNLPVGLHQIARFDSGRLEISYV